MNRQTFAVTVVTALLAPEKLFAARGGTIPYTPRDTRPYYKPGPELIRNQHRLDPKIRKTVLRVNESGWVWTAESCQGGHRWSNEPMLRLVCRSSDAGEMLKLLFECAYLDGSYGETELRLHRHAVAPRGWFEMRVFVYHRWSNQKAGLAVLRRFAEKVNKH